jgi:hypothetical protein
MHLARGGQLGRLNYDRLRNCHPLFRVVAILYLIAKGKGRVSVEFDLALADASAQVMQHSRPNGVH